MRLAISVFILSLLVALPALAEHHVTYNNGKMKPRDSKLKVAVGEQAPDFELPSIKGKKIRLADYRGKNNVVISFVPAAWTPICSDQWPGYNIAQEMFHEYDAVLLGISVDNIPTQYAWSEAMNTITFPVLSDFWPHGKVADSFGVLRSDGMAERALFIIDKKGVIRYIDVHDINTRPDLGLLIKELQKIQ
ncbi:peroxiredoxin [Pseudodesulfovibrio sp. zrk46]|uniref:peroxiredoxin n=1 Tax=Pseudodesulfovibrio sp. zrk46 TaxID=2725288 RepID=UPI001449913A|nr:peroxiredoxin [Pseudodesulfovibrio sp. zrk46]QJB56115.1 peroxiredoxin [Pseudodesulfovibrio sp. zrk46]